MNIQAPSAGEGGGGSKSNITMDSDSVTIKVGKSSIVLKADGTIKVKGLDVDLTGDTHVQVTSDRIDLN